MTGASKIEWTEQTWNPIVGCSIVSPGCTNCYAMNMAGRIEAMGNQPRYDGTTRKVNGHSVWTGKLALAPEATLLAPLRRHKPTTYFVNSMGDLFHEDCPDAWIDRVFAVMALCPRHTFQVLTKRAQRMRDYFEFTSPVRRYDYVEQQAYRLLRDIHGDPGVGMATRAFEALRFWPIPNVWLGVSTERQREADARIPLLLRTPAAIRFISAEPLLGPIDLTNIRPRDRYELNALTGFDFDQGGLRERIDWVIAGGESGPGARPMHPEWPRRLRDQCAAAGTAFFFKQWGEWLPGDGDCPGQQFYKVGKRKAGRLLDGVEHNGMPTPRRAEAI